jgi:hypothetical protein
MKGRAWRQPCIVRYLLIVDWSMSFEPREGRWDRSSIRRCPWWSCGPGSSITQRPSKEAMTQGERASTKLRSSCCWIRPAPVFVAAGGGRKWCHPAQPGEGRLARETLRVIPRDEQSSGHHAVRPRVIHESSGWAGRLIVTNHSRPIRTIQRVTMSPIFARISADPRSLPRMDHLTRSHDQITREHHLLHERIGRYLVSNVRGEKDRECIAPSA